MHETLDRNNKEGTVVVGEQGNHSSTFNLP